MNATPTTNKRGGERLVDSPWFWVCLFGAAAVAGLLAIGPKYQQREARLESSFRMREHLARSWAAGQAGHDPAAASDSERSDNTSLIRSTGPLVWILLVAVAAAWSGLIWSRRKVALHAPRDQRAEDDTMPELSPTRTSAPKHAAPQ